MQSKQNMNREGVTTHFFIYFESIVLSMLDDENKETFSKFRNYLLEVTPCCT